MTEHTFSYLIGVLAALILAALSRVMLGRRKSRRLLGIRRGHLVPAVVFIATLVVAGALAGWFRTPGGAPGAPLPTDRAGAGALLDSLLLSGKKLAAAGDIRGAVEVYGEAATLAIQFQDDVRTGRAFADLAECYVLLGDIEQAREYYRDQALPLFTKPQRYVPRGMAIAKRALGDLERRVGDRDSARAFYNDAREIYTSLQDDLGVASVLHGLSQLERTEGQFDSARAHLTLADSLLKSIGHILGRANILHSFGDLEIEQGDADSAQARYSEALRLAQQAQNPLGEANALYGLGNVALVKKDTATAEARFTTALAIYGRIGNRLGQANIAVGQGDLQALRRDVTGASRYYQKAIGLYRALGMQTETDAVDQKLRRLRQPGANTAP